MRTIITVVSCSNEVIPLLLLVASKVTPLLLHLVSATNKQASHLGNSQDVSRIFMCHQEVCHPIGALYLPETMVSV